MPNYETGHIKNVQKFEELVAFVTGWGPAYQPSNTAIALVSLNSVLSDAQTALVDVADMLTASKVKINARETEYADLNKLVTRAVAYYESTDPDQNQIDDVRSAKRKLDGVRAKEVKDDPETPEDESANAISASQQSFTKKSEHFHAIINLLNSDVKYDPSETEYTITQLHTKLAAMQSANTAVINADVAISNSRATRNEKMYADSTGLVDLAMLVKKYAKAAFGIGSVQYQQVKGLKFNRPPVS